MMECNRGTDRGTGKRVCLRGLALALVLGLVLGVLPAAAQQGAVTVEARLDERQLSPGVATYMQILIQGGIPEDIPATVPARGLSIEKAGVSFNDVIINGVQTVGAQVLYAVSGSTEGSYEIPAIPFRFKGREIATEPIPIEIVKMSGEEALSSSRPYFMTFRATKTEAYVGELVPVELELFVRGNNTIGRPGRPQFENGEKFVIKPFPTSYRPGLRQIDGLPFSTVRFPTQVAALAPGEHVLGPAVTETAITKPVHSLLPRSMLRYSETRAITSNDLTFSIKALPEEGRPASFQGAVGRFEMEVGASPASLRVGDPISVSIRIRGKGNFDSLTAPGIAEGPGWRTYPVTRQEDSGESGAEQTVSFSQVVLPLTIHEALPSLELAFFDPEEERYVVETSAPIPLTIEPDPLLAPQSAGTALSRVGIPQEELDDILYIHVGKPRWATLHASLTERGSFWAMQAVPFLVLCGLAGFSGWKRYARWKGERDERERYSLNRLRQVLSGSVSRKSYYEAVLEHLERCRAERCLVWNDLSPGARKTLEELEREGNAFLYAGLKGDNRGVSGKEVHRVLESLEEVELQKKRETTREVVTA